MPSIRRPSGLSINTAGMSGDYAQALRWLESLEQLGWKLDLGRIRRLCELAGHPQRTFRSLLVGGSAGKGSTCAYLAAIFQEAGYRTGSSPKPHLVSHCERIRVNGTAVAPPEFAMLAARVRPLTEQVAAEGDPPTVFEAITLMSFLHFAGQKVDCAVVEVGLGGRFDATNVLEPDLSVITMIGLDHTDRLGATVEAIAREKAGIVRLGGRLVTGAAGAALTVIEALATSAECRIRRLPGELLLQHVTAGADGVRFDLQTPDGAFPGLHTRMLGRHQAENAGLAVGAAGWLRDLYPALDEPAIRRGVAEASLPARMQVVSEKPLVVVDGAHSPDRARALRSALLELYLPRPGDGSVHLVIGASAGHDPVEVVGLLAPLASRVAAVQARHPHSIPADEVAAAVTERPVKVHASVADAVDETLSEAGEDDLVLITGSLFVAGEALQALGALPG